MNMLITMELTLIFVICLCCNLIFNYTTVLGLARTGLIFTGLQEGAQPGGGG